MGALEFQTVFADFLTDVVQVQTKTGDGPDGATFADAVPVGGNLQYAAKQSRLNDLEQATSDATFYAPLYQHGVLTVGSLVTLPDGRERTISASMYRDYAAMPSHVEVTLV